MGAFVTRLATCAACLYAALAAFLLIGAPVSAQKFDQASTSAKAIRSLPIFYDPALAATGFPNPFLKAKIAGQEAIFILDTGSNRNFLADWYVRLAKIPTRAMTDSMVNGSVIPRIAHRIQGRWSDGQRFNLKDTMVVPFPPYFESNHIGGIVSPQFLTPVGLAAVLDLKTPSLRFAPFTRALSDMQQSNPSSGRPPLHQACHSEEADQMYLAPVTVAGVTDLVTIDTGATKTVFSDGSNIAHAIADRSEPGPPSEQLAGKMNGERMVRNVQLTRGGRSVELNPSIAKPSWPCNSQGLLGMDALRNCLLILGKDQMAFKCD
jgi:hypothetical protein